MKKILSLVFTAALQLQAEESITIFNQFALMRHDLEVDWQQGKNDLSIDRITAQLDTDSIILRDKHSKLQFNIHEQSYRNDTLSPELLMKQFEGKIIHYEVTDANGNKSKVPAEIINAENQLLKVNGTYRFGMEGNPIFPSLGNDNILKPKLGWKIDSQKPQKGALQLSYLTSGFHWQATYNAVVSDDKTMDLSAWITLQNQSGANLENVRVKLIAGDINRSTPSLSLEKNILRKDAASPFSASKMMSSESPMADSKSFSDFQMYLLPNPIDLKNKETKQVEFLKSKNIPIVKRYIFNPIEHPQLISTSLEGVPTYSTALFYEFENKKEYGLGAPLPAGIFRIYQEDKDDKQLEFIGENSIQNTAEKEKVSLATGYAFNVIGSETPLKQTTLKKEFRELKIAPKSGKVEWNPWIEISTKSDENTKPEDQNSEPEISIQPNAINHKAPGKRNIYERQNRTLLKNSITITLKNRSKEAITVTTQHPIEKDALNIQTPYTYEVSPTRLISQQVPMKADSEVTFTFSYDYYTSY